MATNFVQEGNVIDWYNGTGSDVDSGALVQVGFRGMGVALGDIASTATGSVMIDGVFDLALDASDTTTIGAPAWWDGAKCYNDVAAGRYFIGHFTEVKSAAASQTVGVKLAPFAAEPPRFLTMAATGAQTLAAANLLSGRCHITVPNTAALTITLPALADVPRSAMLSVIKSTAAGAGTAVTLDGAGDETVDGSATLATIDAPDDNLTLAATAADWTIAESALA